MCHLLAAHMQSVHNDKKKKKTKIPLSINVSAISKQHTDCCKHVYLIPATKRALTVFVIWTGYSPSNIQFSANSVMGSVQHDESMESFDDEPTSPAATESSNANSSDDDDSTAASENAASTNNKRTKHTLYLRFHRRPLSSADVQKLDAAIISVRLPRQKNARHCLVDFRSDADLRAANERLSQVIVGEHRLIVNVANSTNATLVAQKAELIKERREARAVLHRLIGCLDQVSNTDPKRSVTHGVFVRDLPRDIRRSEVEAVYPDALEVRIILPERSDQKAGASVELPSPADALKARKSRVVIRDVSYKPEFQRDGKHSVRVAKRLSSRGVSMGPARYFLGSDGQVADEVKEETEEDAEVADEIMKVYN